MITSNSKTRTETIVTEGNTIPLINGKKKKLFVPHDLDHD